MHLFRTMDMKKEKYLLMMGFIILLCSLIVAFQSPAENYELNIYTSTPLAYWAGIAIILILSIIVSISRINKIEMYFSLILAGMAIISIVSLPIIRNYYYFGMADSISHLRFANAIIKGSADVGDSFYPAIHLLGVFIRSLTGLPLRICMMLNIPLFAGIFLLFIPLTLKKIHGKFNKDLIIIGAYSAFLFLPINNIGIHFQPHPSSQAVLFSPVLIYLFFKYNRQKTLQFLILYVMLFLGFLFIHPQHALSFILLISIIVIWSRWYKKDDSFSIRMPIVFVLLFWMWVGYNLKFQRSIQSIFNRLFYGDLEVAAGVTQRGMSLSLIGGSLTELFLKLFLVTIIFGILTLIYLYKSRNNTKINKDGIRYLIIGMIPITLLFFIYFISIPGPGQDFRYLGIIFMLLTITGAYSIFYINQKIKIKPKKIIILTFIFVTLILSVPIYFNSPWIYSGNPQITETHYEGYKTTFSNYNENLNLGSVRMQSYRYFSIIRAVSRGDLERSQFQADPSDHFNNQSLSTYYESRTYLAITEYEFIVDSELYRGFRFSLDDFRYLEKDLGINKIQTNGGYNLFLINPQFISR